MARVREEAKAEQAANSRTRIALALTGLAVVGLAAIGFVSQANAAIDPSASAILASALKPDLQKTLKKSVPGLVVTKVTCYVPTTSPTVAGPCTARFTVAKYGLKGTYKATARLSATSQLSWKTSSRDCTDLHGRRASCTGESNTGGGLISAQLAETQLLTNGFTFQNAAKKAKTALCTGSKAQKWLHGKFDDVFTQLNCVVRAADGSYSIVFKMAGADGYNLTKVTKR